jgi:hypothetical protein
LLSERISRHTPIYIGVFFFSKKKRSQVFREKENIFAREKEKPDVGTSDYSFFDLIFVLNIILGDAQLPFNS